MLIVFRAEGAADITMFADVAQALLEVIGKEPGERGVVTVEQLPEAIARLRQASARDRAHPQPLGPGAGSAGESDDEGGAKVTLSQRAFPLIDLLERARRGEVPVIWEPNWSNW